MSNESVVEQAVRETTANVLSNKLYGNFAQLKKRANWFLDGIIQSVDELQHQELLMDSYSIINNITLFYKTMNKSTELTRDVVLYVSELENSINQFLGREIYLLYIFQDGNLLNLDSIHSELLLQAVTHGTPDKKGNPSGSGKFGSIRFIQNLAKYLQDNDKNSMRAKIQQRLNKSASLRNKVFQKAVQRFSSNSPKGIMHYKPSQRTFYWHLNSTYGHLIQGWTDPLKNIGVIAEAYANAVVQENPFITNSNDEFGLMILWYSHNFGDNASAIERGDVVWKQNGKIQFAVKSGKFNTANVGQYLRFAYIIANLEDLTPERLESVLKDIGNLKITTSSIIQKLKEESEKKIINELKID